MAHNEKPETLLKLANASLRLSNLTSNASATVTISNVAPAAVGTATISKWLEVVDVSSGISYFIPCWT